MSRLQAAFDRLIDGTPPRDASAVFVSVKQQAHTKTSDRSRPRVAFVALVAIVLVGAGAWVLQGRSTSPDGERSSASDVGDVDRTRESAGPPDASTPRRLADADVWTPLRLPGAEEAEVYESVEGMADSADLVVVGTLSSVSEGRTWVSPVNDEDVFFYVDATFDVVDVLKGEPAGEALTVEFVSGAPSIEILGDDVDALGVAVGGGDIVLFLREKSGSEAGLLRLVNSYGLVTETERKPVDVPLAEVPETLDPAASQTENGETVVDTRDQWANLVDFIADLRAHLSE